MSIPSRLIARILLRNQLLDQLELLQYHVVSVSDQTFRLLTGDVLTDDDDGEQHKLQERLSDPCDESGGTSTHRFRKRHESEASKGVGTPHGADPTGDLDGQPAIEAIDHVHSMISPLTYLMASKSEADSLWMPSKPRWCRSHSHIRLAADSTQAPTSSGLSTASHFRSTPACRLNSTWL